MHSYRVITNKKIKKCGVVAYSFEPTTTLKLKTDPFAEVNFTAIVLPFAESFLSVPAPSKVKGAAMVPVTGLHVPVPGVTVGVPGVLVRVGVRVSVAVTSRCVGVIVGVRVGVSETPLVGVQVKACVGTGSCAVKLLLDSLVSAITWVESAVAVTELAAGKFSVTD